MEKEKEKKAAEREAARIQKRDEKPRLAHEKQQRATEKQRQEEGKDAEKAIQSSQKSDYMASNKQKKQRKLARCTAAAVRVGLARPAAPQLPTVTNSRGRLITRPARYI